MVDPGLKQAVFCGCACVRAWVGGRLLSAGAAAARVYFSQKAVNAQRRRELLSLVLDLHSDFSPSNSWIHLDYPLYDADP